MNKNRSKIGFLFSYSTRYIIRFIIILITIFIVTGLDIALPRILGDIVDRVEQLTNTKEDSMIPKLAILYLALSFIMRLLRYIYTLALNLLGNKIVANIRYDVFSHVEGLSLSYFHKNPVGALVSRISNDTEKLQQIYSGVLVNLVRNILLVILLSIYMIYLDTRLGLVTISIIPFVLLISIIFRLKSRKRFFLERKEMSILNAKLAENISGMKIIQAFNQEDKQYNKFDNQNKKHLKNYVGVVKLASIFRPMLYLLRMLSTASIFLVGGYLVINGELSIGILVTFILYSSLFFEPITQLADQMNVIQQALAACENINHILLNNEVIEENNDLIELDSLEDIEIEFKNVYFEYVKDETILNNVSFKVEKKSTVAFVGPTGGGKSTILKLIGRYYDVTSGEILINNKNIKEYSIKSLRTVIGQMLQDVKMFTGTIKDNITMFNDSYKDSDIKESLEFVNATKLINKHKEGINYKVANNGTNFSSGERQLLSFARTIIKKPKLLILDEATSNIDSETEQIIQETLIKMMSIGTMLIVAHRLSTIQHSDKIIFISNGEIVESGNHHNLLKKKGRYFELFEMQYSKHE